MATITQNKKEEKITSYKFRTCVGRDEFGKQIFRCCTWKAPDGMIPCPIALMTPSADIFALVPRRFAPFPALLLFRKNQGTQLS